MSERDALALAAWFAAAAFVASVSAGVLAQLARSQRRVWLIAFCAIAFGLAFILFALTALTFVM